MKCSKCEVGEAQQITRWVPCWGCGVGHVSQYRRPEPVRPVQSEPVSQVIERAEQFKAKPFKTFFKPTKKAK